MIKKINQNAGISLIVLLITIVVFLILLTVIVVSADNIINNTKKRQFAKEIYQIQNLVDRYKYENEEYPYKYLNDNNYEEVEFKIDDKIDSQFLNEVKDYQNNIKLYPIDLIKIGAKTLSRGISKDNNPNDVYVFSKDTGKVYYLKGYKVDKNIYYTLTNELRNLIGLKSL